MSKVKVQQNSGSAVEVFVHKTAKRPASSKRLSLNGKPRPAGLGAVPLATAKATVAEIIGGSTVAANSAKARARAASQGA